LIVGRLFVKRFALCYRTVVCLSVCIITLVHSAQTVRWMKMPLDTEVPRPHCVRWGPSSPTDRAGRQEKCKKTPAQRQREYRARRDADQVKRTLYLQKEREAWKKRCKPMKELTDRQKRARRRVNREGQRRYRNRQKLLLQSSPALQFEDITSSTSRFVVGLYIFT